jgi:hypothetical protein
MKYINKISQFWLTLFVLFLTACDKETASPLSITPTDHPISKLGAEMRFVIKTPENNFYNFSSDDSILNCDGDYCKDFLVPLSEMNELALKLSDTTIFNWKFMTAESPYPDDDCVMLVYWGMSTSEYIDYMCSIGKGKSAIEILSEISKSFSGEVNGAFDEIVSSLE